MVLVIVDIKYITDVSIVLLNMIITVILSYLYTRLISDMQTLK